jgi:hypothetical protein
MIAACNEEHSTEAGLEQSDCLWSGLYDQSANSARGLLCESWMGLYWPSCLMWALSLSWLLEYNFRASLLTWALILSMPVCSCYLGSLVIILNTLFWKNWSLLRKPKLFLITFKNSVRTSKRTQRFTITTINLLALFKEIISVYTENYTKPTNTKYSITDG